MSDIIYELKGDSGHNTITSSSDRLLELVNDHLIITTPNQVCPGFTRVAEISIHISHIGMRNYEESIGIKVTAIGNKYANVECCVFRSYVMTKALFACTVFVNKLLKYFNSDASLDQIKGYVNLFLHLSPNELVRFNTMIEDKNNMENFKNNLSTMTDAELYKYYGDS